MQNTYKIVIGKAEGNTQFWKIRQAKIEECYLVCNVFKKLRVSVD